MSIRMRNVVRYVVPSVGGMLSVFLYIVVDGIFVGRGIGIDALAAVSLASPYTILTGALVSLIAIGGSSVTAIRIGRGDDKGANDAFMTSVVMLIVFSALVTVIGTCFGNVVAKLSGTTPRLIEMTTEYLFYFSLFSSAQAISQLLCTFVRNDGSPRLAFWGMVCGAVSNIFLDWLFVFPLQMGIKGAAIASGLGQIISCLLVVSHFVFKRGKLRFRKLRLSAPLFRKVAMRGLPEFITQLFPTITILCYNHTIIRYFGETVGEFWVSAFSIVSFIASLSIAIFTGVGEGIQPLLGQSYGKKSTEDINYYFKAGLFINVGLSALLYLVLLFLGTLIMSLFNSDTTLIADAHLIMPLYGLSFVLSAMNITMTVFFLSTKRTAQAVTISFCRSVLFNSLIITLIPIFGNDKLLWSALIFSELLSLAVALILKRKADKKGMFTNE